jgi:hypothetical protein
MFTGQGEVEYTGQNYVSYFNKTSFFCKKIVEVLQIF